MEELLKKLKELDADLADKVQEEISKRNEEAKKYRTKKTETEKTLLELLSTLGTKEPEEAKTKIETSNNEIKALTEKIGNMEKMFQEEKTKAEKLGLENEVISKLKKFKVEKNFDFLKDSLVTMAQRGESGEIIVKDKTIDDYLQKIIDEDETIVNSKKKTTSQKSEDLYTFEELEALTDEEYAKNIEKVDRSLANLGK